MSDRQYSEALQPLFQLSADSVDPYELDAHNFLEMGITAEHIPELTELILDEKYYLSEDEDLGYPQLFAYQALGQLKTESAIDALVEGTRRWSDTDWFEWFTEAMPDIFGLIGCSAISSIVKLLQDTTAHVHTRTSAVDYIEKIGVAHPECRVLCVAALTEQLQKFNENDPTLNGFLITVLVIDLKTLAAADLIEAAFQADRVDKKIVGDWDDVQVYLGLKSIKDLPPARRRQFWGLPEYEQQFSGFSRPPERTISEFLGEFVPQAGKEFDPHKAKTKRKQQKQARQKNRRKK
jgi:hypothetical protein